MKIYEAGPPAAKTILSNVGHGWSNEKPQLFAHTLDCWIRQRPLSPELDSASKQSAEGLS